MHSVLHRGNSTILFALIVLASLTIVCFTSNVFQDFRSHADMKAVTVSVANLQAHSGSKEGNDVGFLTFNLQTNMSHLFNWNVRQLFLYLTAEYHTGNNKFNQVVLWDKIIHRGQNAVLGFKNANIKYYFWDDGNGLMDNKNITLKLSWNVIPNVGFLPNIQSCYSHLFKFPAEYTTLRL